MTATIGTDFPGGHSTRGIQARSAAGGAHILDGQDSAGAQFTCAVEEQDTPAAMVPTTPMRVPPQGSQAGRGQGSGDTHPNTAPATALPDGHLSSDTHNVAAVGGQTPPPWATADSVPTYLAPGVAAMADPLLALLADSLDDLERTRIANENRLRQLTRDAVDADGEERGFALPTEHPVVKQIAAVLDGIAELEHQAELNLGRRLRQHPLGAWVKVTKGVGEKQGARLLAAIGDPCWNTLYERPRTVSELWAYCGLHTDGETAVRRARGVRSNWSSVAKSRAYLIADSCIKQRCTACKETQGDEPNRHASVCTCSPYRVIYDEAREKYAYAVHRKPCPGCTPKPAPIGSPLSPGHQDNCARRYVAKRVLKDLWRAARDIHLAAGDAA